MKLIGLKYYVLLIFYCFYLIFYLSENFYSSKKKVFKNSNLSNSKKNNFYGVSSILIGKSLQELNLDLKSLDLNFKGFQNSIEYNYYNVIPELKNKIINNFLIKIINDRLYHKKLLEYYLINSSKNSLDNSTNLENKILSDDNLPIKNTLLFNNYLIHPQLDIVHLKFYDKKLYDCYFSLKLNASQMNDLVLEYHSRFGNKSLYNKITENYIWIKNSIQILLNLSLKSTDNLVTIQFIDLNQLKIIQTDSDTIHNFIIELLTKKDKKNKKG